MPVEPAVRCLIDSMVFDAIVAEPGMPAEVDRLTRARSLELLAAAETMEEIAAVADEEHRRRLQRVRVFVVPPVDVEAARWAGVFASLLRARGVSEEDARIALAAAAREVPLVTEDRDLREAVAALLPRVALWTWAADLRPRIVAP